ncbi:MAG TPA: hypothetical protein VHK88_20165 [Aquihabitans sp.]|jgi:hypothetical protein|nr:hypothetical protein [Aquihabitans sp.]
MPSIATTTETVGGGDYRWLRSARGTGHPKSGTLDISAFTANTHYPDGYVRSGTPVTFDAVSGLYEPAAATSTATGLAGFVWHDVAVQGAADLTFAVIEDATINSDFIPVPNDLVDTRYICDAVAVAGA